MDIYLHKDGQQLGPFSESELRTQLSGGRINETDLAWAEGNTDWQPLSTILQPTRPSGGAGAACGAATECCAGCCTAALVP